MLAESRWRHDTLLGQVGFSTTGPGFCSSAPTGTTFPPSRWWEGRGVEGESTIVPFLPSLGTGAVDSVPTDGQ